VECVVQPVMATAAAKMTAGSCLSAGVNDDGRRFPSKS
jgi:hypothetical protein